MKSLYSLSFSFTYWEDIQEQKIGSYIEQTGDKDLQDYKAFSNYLLPYQEGIEKRVREHKRTLLDNLDNDKVPVHLIKSIINSVLCSHQELSYKSAPDIALAQAALLNLEEMKREILKRKIELCANLKGIDLNLFEARYLEITKHLTEKEQALVSFDFEMVYKKGNSSNCKDWFITVVDENEGVVFRPFLVEEDDSGEFKYTPFEETEADSSTDESPSPSPNLSEETKKDSTKKESKQIFRDKKGGIFALAVIALRYYFSDTPITREESKTNTIAKKYGWKSGHKLYQKYNEVVDKAGKDGVYVIDLKRDTGKYFQAVIWVLEKEKNKEALKLARIAQRKYEDN